MRRGQVQKIQHLSRWAMGLFMGLSLFLVGQKVVTTPDVSAETKKVKPTSDTKLKAKVTTSNDVTHRTLARLRKLVDLQARAHVRLQLEVQRSLQQERRSTKEKVSRLLRRIGRLQQEIQIMRLTQAKQRVQLQSRIQKLQQEIQVTRQAQEKRTQLLRLSIKESRKQLRILENMQTYSHGHERWSRWKQGSLKPVKGLPGGYQVRIPSGTFWMGANGKSLYMDNQLPRRKVRITKSFWMLDTEVTQQQFQAIMGYNPSRRKARICSNARCPVYQVTWHEAAAFANALSRIQKLPYCFRCQGEKQSLKCTPISHASYVKCSGWRLPTEAEWEYSYRAYTQTLFYTGMCLSRSQAHVGGIHYLKTCPKGEPRIHGSLAIVGSYPPNPWGLYDMAGNAWEWVYDLYSPKYNQSEVTDPVGPLQDHRYTQHKRAIRGGSGGHVTIAAEAAHRAYEIPSGYKTILMISFRLVRLVQQNQNGRSRK